MARNDTPLKHGSSARPRLSRPTGDVAEGMSGSSINELTAKLVLEAKNVELEVPASAPRTAAGSFSGKSAALAGTSARARP